MEYLENLIYVVSNFSGSTYFVILSFSAIIAMFMKERIGAAAAILYFPVMVGSALLSNFLFWYYRVFRGDQDVERVFSATILGMMCALLIIILINNARESYWRVPVGKYLVGDD